MNASLLVFLNHAGYKPASQNNVELVSSNINVENGDSTTSADVSTGAPPYAPPLQTEGTPTQPGETENQDDALECSVFASEEQPATEVEVTSRGEATGCNEVEQNTTGGGGRRGEETPTTQPPLLDTTGGGGRRGEETPTTQPPLLDTTGGGGRRGEETPTTQPPLLDTTGGGGRRGEETPTTQPPLLNTTGGGGRRGEETPQPPLLDTTGGGGRRGEETPTTQPPLLDTTGGGGRRGEETPTTQPSSRPALERSQSIASATQDPSPQSPRRVHPDSGNQGQERSRSPKKPRKRSNQSESSPLSSPRGSISYIERRRNSSSIIKELVSLKRRGSEREESEKLLSTPEQAGTRSHSDSDEN